MEEAWKSLLKQTDDEYLIGLCNKGTVKRAYKDLEQETPSLCWKEDGAEITLKETVCRIRMPLGESACSCPSRSICRHVITAVLYLKKTLEEPGAEAAAAAEGAAAPDTGAVIKADEEERVPGASEEAVRAEQAEDPSGRDLKQALEQELLGVSLEKLKRACGSRRYQELLAYLQGGEQAEIQEGTVITVKVPWEEPVVKLLSPLAYSTCTCHSKELCRHKAQAVLLFQLHRKAVTLEQLCRHSECAAEWDRKEIERAAVSIQEGIRLQILTGLSRLSPEAAESMERLAVISHGAGLASCETELRKAASEYRLYSERSAAFRTQNLLEQLLALYRKAEGLKRAENPEQIRALAGSFRDTYRPISRLHLMGLGGRSFHSKTGYEGEIYYFLEPEKGSFYTWTDARPVFYEGVRRKPAGSGEQAQAPWGLNCNREQMMELEFYLEHAKAAGGVRLSVSQETKSEILGLRDFRTEEVRRNVFWNYEELLRFCFQDPKAEDGGERAALVGAVSCREADFDTVQQRFSMELTDVSGQKLTVAVTYTKEEKLTIQVLERFSERLKKQGDRPLVFFGLPYLKEGRLWLYPVEIFEGERFFSEPGEMEQYLRDKGLWEEGRKEEADGQGDRPDRDAGPDKELLQGMKQFLEEIQEALGDLFQSGLNSVLEETLGNLERLAEESSSLGLHRAGSDLAFLKKALSEKRHQMEFDPKPVLEVWVQLTDYVRICLEKVSLDQALLDMNCIS